MELVARGEQFQRLGVEGVEGAQGGGHRGVVRVKK